MLSAAFGSQGIMLWLFISGICSVIFLYGFGYAAKLWRRLKNKTTRTVAFFHPYCDNGGGGERVLWVAIAALLQPSVPDAQALADAKDLQVLIYTGDVGKSIEDILRNVETKFGIRITSLQAKRLSLVHITTRTLLAAEWYPVATMVGQSLGSMLVTLECLWRCAPDVFCDTMGAAFGYPLVKLFARSKVIAYVHYPIVSKDMLQKVREQRPSYNNTSLITSSVSVSQIKLLYYQLFAWAYGRVGRSADTVLVNSTWTRRHIQDLWGFPAVDNPAASRRLQRVFPPCNTSALQSIPLERPLVYTESTDMDLGNKIVMLSIGQFRPEKDHFLQLKIMESLVKDDHYQNVVLLMVGSVRNKEDSELVQQLSQYIISHNLMHNVQIITNSSHSHLLHLLSTAAIGLHTMWNEHFGISIVEKMAAGLLTLAHNSGGPASDIIRHRQTGFLASTQEEYVSCIKEMVGMEEEERMKMKRKAREHVSKNFADAEFVGSICTEFSVVLDSK